MTLQELLNYRTVCFLHNQPMKPHFKKKMGSNAQMALDFILLEKTETGLETRVKNANPNPGASISLDGTISITDNQNALQRIIKQPFSVIMMCDTCVRTPVYDDRDINQGDFIFRIADVQKECHFYSFTVNPNFVFGSLTPSMPFQRAMSTAKPVAQFVPGREVIMCRRDLKFYHMVTRLPDGPTQFKMGTCDEEATLDTLLKGYMNINADNYSAANIKSIDQLVNKIRLYNLFS